MPPLDFSTSQPEENEELIYPEELFAPEEAAEPEEEEGKRGKGRLREEAEGRIKKRGEREIDKFFEEKWGPPKGAGTSAGRGVGKEIGGQATRGAVGAGGRAAGGAGARAAAGGAARAGAGVAARGAASLAAGAAEGAAAGSVVPGVGTAIGAVVMTALSLPKSFAAAFKGEYSRLEPAEFTIVAVACAFIDGLLFFGALAIFVPGIGVAIAAIAVISGPPVRMMTYSAIAFWLTKHKGSEKPWGMFRLIWKLVSSWMPVIPVLTPTFILEGLAHNHESQDTLLGESKRTKEKGKNEKKAGGAPAPSEPGVGGTPTPRGSGGAPGPRAAGIKR